jgi:putative exporter of polyketide antibiotics
MVAVVLLTTLVTPVALRGAFQLRSPQDIEEGVLAPRPAKERAQRLEVETGPAG